MPNGNNIAKTVHSAISPRQNGQANSPVTTSRRSSSSIGSLQRLHRGSSRRRSAALCSEISVARIPSIREPVEWITENRLQRPPTEQNRIRWAAA